MQGTYDRLNEMLNRELSAVLLNCTPYQCCRACAFSSLSLTGVGKAGLWAMCVQAAMYASISWVRAERNWREASSCMCFSLQKPQC